VDLRTYRESRGDGTRILRVAGELDMHTSPKFQEELQAVIEQPFEWLLVDLTDCDYLDSSAIHVLAQAERSLDGRADKLALVIPNPHQRRIFELTGLDEVLHIHPDRDAALPENSNA
jgi:anti-sigma B factor antagonist